MEPGIGEIFGNPGNIGVLNDTSEASLRSESGSTIGQASATTSENSHVSETVEIEKSNQELSEDECVRIGSIDGEQGSVGLNEYKVDDDKKTACSAAKLAVRVELEKRKRAQVSSTGSNTGIVEVKKRREGLRQKFLCRLPSRFNDFVVQLTTCDPDDGV
uniref:Uncharacterized protein n=1 Tax=Peronospora matthiolae TaxID=2874970 RepID=A0AAV1V383_9STRA